MNLLAELGLKYGTDKGTKHHYLDVYYDLFKDRRESVKKVLEIGTAEGASLFMWKDFFPNATIYGAEIDQARVDKLQGLDRIEVFNFDQASVKDFMNIPYEDIDLVVDDGSHVPSDQLLTCLGLMQLLNKNVIYVIEDVADENIAKYLTKYDVEVRRVGKRYDDRLIIVKHKNG